MSLLVLVCELVCATVILGHIPGEEAEQRLPAPERQQDPQHSPVDGREKGEDTVMRYL